MTDPIAFRAGALCAASEPHRAPGEDWPCERCLSRVRHPSAAAVSGAAGGPPPAVAPDTGVSGPSARLVPQPEPGPDSTSEAKGGTQ